MAYLPNINQNAGLFVQQTPLFDVGQIYSTDVNSDDFKELIVRLYQQMNNVSTALNLKESGYCITTEFVTGKLFFAAATVSEQEPPNMRPVYRLVVNTGALGAGANTIPHNLSIGTTWSFISIYGAATDTTNNNYYPLPWVKSTGATNIEVELNATNVVITNASGLTFPVSYIILEYIKQ